MGPPSGRPNHGCWDPKRKKVENQGPRRVAIERSHLNLCPPVGPAGEARVARVDPLAVRFRPAQDPLLVRARQAEPLVEVHPAHGLAVVQREQPLPVALPAQAHRGPGLVEGGGLHVGVGVWEALAVRVGGGGDEEGGEEDGGGGGQEREGGLHGAGGTGELW